MFGQFLCGLGSGFCTKVISLSFGCGCRTQDFPWLSGLLTSNNQELSSCVSGPPSAPPPDLSLARLQPWILLSEQPHASRGLAHHMQACCLVTVSQAQVRLVQACLTSQCPLPQSWVSGHACSGESGGAVVWT